MSASLSPICRKVSRVPPASGKTSTPRHGPSPAGRWRVPLLGPSGVGIGTSRWGISSAFTGGSGGVAPRASTAGSPALIGPNVPPICVAPRISVARHRPLQLRTSYIDYEYEEGTTRHPARGTAHDAADPARAPG